MADSMKDPRSFFTKGTSEQYNYVLDFYEEAVKLRAEHKNKKVEDFLKIDKWYQTDLPKAIKKRGKDAHLTHEELVKCMRWKLSRGRFSPRLKDLITMNTPRLCIAETKKAFRALQKKDDLSSAVTALCNLKGVGPAMASAILTAAFPERCGFMADECMMAIPEIETIDYTTKELLNFTEQLKFASERLNRESGSSNYNPHKVEQALWAHFVLGELNKDIIDKMPDRPAITENGITSEEASKNGPSQSPSDASADKENRTQIHTNGASEDSRSALSLNEDTNDSIAISETPSEVNSEANNIDSVDHSEIEEDSRDTPISQDVPSSSCNSPSPSPKNSPIPIEIDSTSSNTASSVTDTDSNSVEIISSTIGNVTNSVEQVSNSVEQVSNSVEPVSKAVEQNDSADTADKSLKRSECSDNGTETGPVTTSTESLEQSHASTDEPDPKKIKLDQ